MGGGIELGIRFGRRFPGRDELGDFAAFNDHPATGVIGEDGKGIL